MPCAKLGITNKIFKTYKKKCDNSFIHYSGKTIIIPILTLSKSFPFRPRGKEIGEIIIYSNYLKKIKKQQFNSIIQKYNTLLTQEYCCGNHKSKIEDKLIDEAELFIRYIVIRMGWNEDEFNNNVKVFLNKKDSWDSF